MIVRANPPKDTAHFEADMFFLKNGVYEFDGMLIGEAHEWCQQCTRECLEDDVDVIVSNTLTTIKELRPYVWMAKDTGSKLNVINCLGNFGNIHSVPDQVLINMRQRFVHDISPLLIEYGFLAPYPKETK
jgi:hypothetical protein